MALFPVHWMYKMFSGGEGTCQSTSYRIRLCWYRGMNFQALKAAIILINHLMSGLGFACSFCVRGSLMQVYFITSLIWRTFFQDQIAWGICLLWDYEIGFSLVSDVVLMKAWLTKLWLSPDKCTCLVGAGVSNCCEMPTSLVFIAIKTAMLIGPPSGKDTKMSAHLSKDWLAN